MTEQELDLFMRNVLLDAIALDEETNTETRIRRRCIIRSRSRQCSRTLCAGHVIESDLFGKEP